MPRIARSVIDAKLGKPALPDLSQVSQFFLQAVGESAFDELHGPFNGRIACDREQQMQVVRHDDEIVQLKFSRRYVGTQHVDQQQGIALGLVDSPEKFPYCFTYLAKQKQQR